MCVWGGGGDHDKLTVRRGVIMWLAGEGVIMMAFWGSNHDGILGEG